MDHTPIFWLELQDERMLCVTWKLVTFCKILKYSDFNVVPLSNFRYLSHKFHGKGPGKNKVEKRMKINEQEGVSISPDLVMSCHL